ncbi:MAG: hypothetical protein WAT36_06455 [Chromatiaceae bacterium]
MSALIGELRELIRSARQAVVQSVDVIQVLTNFEIGRRIVEHDSTARIGRNMARPCSKSFPPN